MSRLLENWNLYMLYASVILEPMHISLLKFQNCHFYYFILRKGLCLGCLNNRGLKLCLGLNFEELQRLHFFIAPLFLLLLLLLLLLLAFLVKFMSSLGSLFVKFEFFFLQSFVFRYPLWD